MDHRASLQMPSAMSSTIGFNWVGSINQDIKIIVCPLNTLVNTLTRSITKQYIKQPHLGSNYG